MAATKRKRDDKIHPPATFSFMLLPLEIRQKVYEYCYIPRPKERGNPQPCFPGLSKPRLTRIVSGKSRERTFFENSRCSHPFLHQSLLLTCRQAYIDAWPYYAACHSLGFTRPIKFANEVLSFMPPPQLMQIKHLYLRVGQEPTSYNVASTLAVKSMVSDVQRLFDHYPDVFHGLISFAWELTDKQNYSPKRCINEKAMYEVLLSNLAKHHQQERDQLEVSTQDASGNLATNLKKWRTGVIARRVELKVDDSRWQHEVSSLVFFERLPAEYPNYDGGRKGLRYIDLASWLNNPISAAVSVGGQHIQTIITPERFTEPLNFEPVYSQRIQWAHGQIDWKSGTDVLTHALLFDIGIDPTQQ